MNCSNCKENSSNEKIPYIVHESAMARYERSQRRLWITVLLLILLLVASNAGWMWYENQFEDISQTVEQEAESGTNTFVGGDLIGKTESDHEEKSP